MSSPKPSFLATFWSMVRTAASFLRVDAVVRLVRALCGALLVVVFCYGVVLLLHGRDLPVLGSFEVSAVPGVDSIAADRRLIRSRVLNDVGVVCVEPPRTVIGRSSDGEARGPDVSALLLLRERAWQLCTAHLDGTLTDDQYSEALLSVTRR